MSENEGDYGEGLNLFVVLTLGWGLNPISTGVFIQICPKAQWQVPTSYLESFCPHKIKIVPTSSQQPNLWKGECLVEHKKHSRSFCSGTLPSLAS